MKIQPRLFWRRSFALVVDIIILYLATALLLIPLVSGNTDNFRLSNSGFTTAKCWNSSTAPQEIHDLAEGFELSALKVCDRWVFGIYNGRTVSLQNITVDQEARSRTTKSLTVPTNEEGVPVQPWIIQDLLVLLAFVLLLPAVMSVWKGATPGKRLLGVRVAGGRLSYKNLCLREVLKWAPVAVALATSLMFAPKTFAAMGAMGFLEMALIYGSTGVATCVWWIVPLIFWKGRMPYDRITGYEIVQKTADAS